MAQGASAWSSSPMERDLGYKLQYPHIIISFARNVCTLRLYMDLSLVAEGVGVGFDHEVFFGSSRKVDPGMWPRKFLLHAKAYEGHRI